jgi:hypothetical protein
MTKNDSVVRLVILLSFGPRLAGQGRARSGGKRGCSAPQAAPIVKTKATVNFSGGVGKNDGDYSPLQMASLASTIRIIVGLSA